MTRIAREVSPFLGDDPVDRAFWHLLLFAQADDAPAPETVRQAVTAVVEQGNKYCAKARYRQYADGEWHGVSRVSRCHPTAIYLYDHAETAEVFCLDLDPNEGRTAADVEIEAGELTRMLERCGLRWIADRSTRGGVHVLIRLDERRSRTELSAMQVELRRQFKTIDKAVMSGPAAMLTMPGSPCKPEPGHGEVRYRHLLGVHSAARLRDWLSGPSEPAAWTALLEHLGLPGDLSMFTTETSESDPRGRPPVRQAEVRHHF